MDSKERMQLVQTAGEIAAAYVSRNAVADLPQLIRQIHDVLVDLATQSFESQKAAAQGRPEPAVPVNKSVMPDYIICLEDGKKLKMLKRYIKTAYNMTPDQYRKRWGLPSDYPMVAPNYAARRSRLAKEIGLGTQSRQK
jgi:predicted transcriptional regulator